MVFFQKTFYHSFSPRTLHGVCDIYCRLQCKKKKRNKNDTLQSPQINICKSMYCSAVKNWLNYNAINRYIDTFMVSSRVWHSSDVLLVALTPWTLVLRTFTFPEAICYFLFYFSHKSFNSKRISVFTLVFLKFLSIWKSLSFFSVSIFHCNFYFKYWENACRELNR